MSVFGWAVEMVIGHRLGFGVGDMMGGFVKRITTEGTEEHRGSPVGGELRPCMQGETQGPSTALGMTGSAAVPTF